MQHDQHRRDNRNKSNNPSNPNNPNKRTDNSGGRERTDRGGFRGGDRGERRPHGQRNDRDDHGGRGDFRDNRDNRGGFGSDKRARFMKRSKESVMEALRSRDMLLRGVTKTMEDLDHTINLLGERLEDWYGIYFPELRTEERLKYADAVLIIDRENLDVKEIASVLGQKKAEEIAQKSESSLGAKISPKDLAQCHALARSMKSLGKLRDEYDVYQKSLAEELCPNLSEVGGADVAAKLVSRVGSVKRLALLPASAVQVIGAEKALFKHLKNRRIAPPKHGIIFQHPKISASPKAVRGKIARALANKLCTAAKADAFTHNPIGVQLRKDFEDRFSQIMKEYNAAKAKNPKPDPDEQDFPEQKLD
ncbi:NOP58 family protein [Candidatus Micrarchaeota archaeon]|nr:NOP58 family protein [Candidatus Micrarchaeota archaeon]